MAMTQDRANGLVLTGLVVSGGLVLIGGAVADKKPAPRFFVGWFVAGIGLAAVAQISPDIAGGVAVLMVITSALVYGLPAWQAISSATKTK